MVATEVIDAEQQLEVRIIRTKGGIKNVAYIADNATSLIVQQSTLSSSSPTSSGCSTSLKDNAGVGKNGAFKEVSHFELAEIPKFFLDNSNLSHQNHFSKEYHSKNKHQQKVEFQDNEINVEVEVQKVNLVNQQQGHLFTSSISSII